jgi:hypothetical protein
MLRFFDPSDGIVLRVLARAALATTARSRSEVRDAFSESDRTMRFSEPLGPEQHVLDGAEVAGSAAAWHVFAGRP